MTNFVNSKNFRKILASPLLIGTFFLTASGIISRVIGFFYKIFLSRAIGAEALGLYQLVFPVFGLMIAISSSGIQTAISRYIADAVGSTGSGYSAEKQARRYLAAGLFYSSLLSFLCFVLLYFFADRIALYLLGDIRCGQLLSILAYALLPSSIHSCINGYYYGKKKALVPSVCQLAEQIARVSGVYLLYRIVTEQGKTLTGVHVVWGLVIGELCGLLVSVTALALSSKEEGDRQKSVGSKTTDDNLETGNRYAADGNRTTNFRHTVDHRSTTNGDFAATLSFRRALGLIGLMAIPLTANQALTHFCSSVENLLIPLRLQEYGCSISESLSLYGVLTGMAMPLIFFPGVLTNSLSVLLLPSISEASAQGKSSRIAHTISLSIYGGLALGFAFTILFLLTGNFIGNVIFENALAGQMIRRLSFLCPLMYVYSLLSGVLHGLGKAKYVFFINLLASGIRIGTILVLVPHYGISAVLWGMLLSQFFSAAAAIFLVQRP